MKTFRSWKLTFGMVAAFALALPLTAMALQTALSADNADQSTIDLLETSLAKASDPRDRAVLQGKIDVLTRHAQTPQFVNASVADKLKATAPPVTARTPGAVGIIDNIVPPVPASHARLTNEWRDEQADGSAINVYAGALTDPPMQGVVIVFRSGQAAPLGGRQEFPTPSAHGAVRIVAAAGTRLQLAAADGTAFTFDATALKFVSP